MLNARKLKTPSKTLEVAIQYPHDIPLEKVVIGACLLDATAFGNIRNILGKEAFFLEPLQTIYVAMTWLQEHSHPIDLLTVTDQLKKMGMIYSETHLETLPKRKKAHYQRFAVDLTLTVECTNMVASAANLEYHSKILYQLYMRRKAIHTALYTIEQAQELKKDVFVLYDELTVTNRAVRPSNILRVQSMNDVLKEGANKETGRLLIGNLVKENEVVILFGDEGTGKSILAFQIADCISKGRSLFNLEGDHFPNQCAPQTTIFYDFEMEANELFDRYSWDGRPYLFDEHFLRSSINPEFLDFENADELIINEIQSTIEIYQPKFVVIDNITYITSESQDPSIATRVMKRLLALQKRFQITILVIAHTPKRDPSQPIESRHLAGAKSLSNFSKSIIAVSHSKQDPDKRYIKHLKCRNGRKIHDADNVIEAVIVNESARIEYEFYGYSAEKDHLEVIASEESKSLIVSRATDLHKEGLGYRSIAKIINDEYSINWAHTTVMRQVQKYLKESDLEGT